MPQINGNPERFRGIDGETLRKHLNLAESLAYVLNKRQEVTVVAIKTNGNHHEAIVAKNSGLSDSDREYIAKFQAAFNAEVESRGKNTS